MSLARRDLERGLREAERTIALSERCRPLDAGEPLRVLEAWRAGREVGASARFAPPPAWGALRRNLERLAEQAEPCGGFGRLYAERARELGVEVGLVEQIGTPGFHRAAAGRYPVDPGSDGQRALEWALAWAREDDRTDAGLVVASDDGHRADSLLSAMRRAVGQRRLPFRVEVRADLLSAAATGDGVIVVRGGARYSVSEVARIVTHEIEGHALPRARARLERAGLFALGSAQGSDDEEGRALLLEERAGLLGPRRRAELGRRHLAALAVREGADFVETVRLILGQGAALEQAVGIGLRVHRGGGLAREIVYLTALSRVRRAFDTDPEAEGFLERGRIAVRAVPLLRELGEPPEVLTAPCAA